jgi:hypothetical protein
MKKVSGFKRIFYERTGIRPPSQTIKKYRGQKPAASDYIYHPAQFTERQENFYNNLLQLYRLTGSKTLPVVFTDDDGNKWKMDQGCVSMAVHDGFLDELQDNPETGYVTEVTLSW